MVCSCGNCFALKDDMEKHTGGKPTGGKPTCKKSKSCRKMKGKCLTDEEVPDDLVQKGWCDEDSGCGCWVKEQGAEKPTGGKPTTCKSPSCKKKGGVCVAKDDVTDDMEVVGKCKPNCACVLKPEESPKKIYEIIVFCFQITIVQCKGK